MLGVKERLEILNSDLGNSFFFLCVGFHTEKHLKGSLGGAEHLFLVDSHPADGARGEGKPFSARFSKKKHLGVKRGRKMGSNTVPQNRGSFPFSKEGDEGEKRKGRVRL